MLKNVVVIEKSPSMPSRNHLLHDISVRDGSLTLRTWFCQAEGVSQPRNGIANGNIHGLDLAPRLDGLVFSPRAKLIVPWEPETMVFGSLHYLCTKYDGSPAHPPFGRIEQDTLANLATPESRILARFPHWHHKRMVDHWRLFAGVPEDIMPVGRIIVDVENPAGFADCRIDVLTTNHGAVGDWDHHDPATGTVLIDTRKMLEDGTSNLDIVTIAPYTPMPESWEFG